MSLIPILLVKKLSVSFGKKKRQVEVIHDISFEIYENEILGVVGESGSGKSVTSMAILGLLPKKSSQLKGEILFEGKNMSRMSELHILLVESIFMF